MSWGEFRGQELAAERAYLGRICGGEDCPQRGSAAGKQRPRPAAMFFDRDRSPRRPRGETVCAGRATSAANRDKRIVLAAQSRVPGSPASRLGSGGLMWFSPALDRAFENKGCVAWRRSSSSRKESPL